MKLRMCKYSTSAEDQRAIGVHGVATDACESIPNAPQKTPASRYAGTPAAGTRRTDTTRPSSNRTWSQDGVAVSSAS